MHETKNVKICQYHGKGAQTAMPKLKPHKLPQAAVLNSFLELRVSFIISLLETTRLQDGATTGRSWQRGAPTAVTACQMSRAEIMIAFQEIS
jgi:hypothetical protein